MPPYSTVHIILLDTTVMLNAVLDLDSLESIDLAHI